MDSFAYPWAHDCTHERRDDQLQRREPRMRLRLHRDVARPAFGWDSLSETERRVAELVAWV